MKIYLVGGAVRDKLLGLPVTEHDWVVVGASVNDMIKQGFHQVGKEFPVFIHPKTGEEYALARMERKVKPGYQGFTFDTSPAVSLEDDLSRRDLTINAMAESEEGVLIDPFNGRQDLRDKILRHVSPAFSEDPVRILRLGRFYARYGHLGFQIAPETIQLMQKMVAEGEVNALVAERVWKELERALGEPHPDNFFAVIKISHALPILFPEFASPAFNGLHKLAKAANHTSSPYIRFAVLCQELTKPVLSTLCQRYRVPNAFYELAKLITEHYTTALNYKTLTADALLAQFYKLDIFRRWPRFQLFTSTCRVIAETEGVSFDEQHFLQAAEIPKQVDVQILLEQGLTGNQLADALKAKRKMLLEVFLTQRP